MGGLAIGVRPGRVVFGLALKLASALALALGAGGCARWRGFEVLPGHAAVPADGRWHVVGRARLRHGAVRAEDLTVSGVGSDRVGLEEDGDGVAIRVRAPVGARQDRLRVGFGGLTRGMVLDYQVDERPDALQAGLPEWMALHAAEDREAFRRWFTTVAERVADLPAGDLPKEVTDCSALLRYSFREALLAHDDRWYAGLGAEEMPAMRSVGQWTYPNTPMGAGLFRTRPGSFQASDLRDGTFAQFADAKTLSGLNTFFVSRSVARARAGDMLFYRLLEDTSQYHSMIVTGGHAEWVVYHTGPITGPHGKTPGEMRRVLLADLERHPDPRWRPLAGNGNFLGVYRWDLLAEDR